MLQKYHQDLTIFFQATHIPFCVFDNTPQDIFRYPLLSNQKCSRKTLKQCVGKLSVYNFHQPVIITFSSCMLALMALDEQTNIMFGPITSVPLTYHQFYSINTLIEDLDDLLHLYKIIQCSPMMTLPQFTSNISLFIKLAFQEDILTEKMIFDIHEQENKISKNTGRSQKNKYISPINIFSTIISFQKNVLQYIKVGNQQGIEDSFEEEMQLICNNITFASSEDAQRFFYSYALICCIAIIEYYVEPKEAYNIFEAYTSMLTSIRSVSDMIEMCRKISLEYCDHVLLQQKKKSQSSIVTNSMQYIQEHIQTKISIDDIAHYCKVSKRTVMRHFSKYYDMSVSKYVMKVKLEEGAFLLEHSNMTFAEISNQLAFSSQSHFSTAFKKRYHCTPQQYRNKYLQ